ncbi:MAG: hypothetical protein IJW86_06460 [Clostridia bacterium]|nr:hypothetical protein [Clostridia bacterium]
MKNKYFKKSISLLMAILMVMTCWVFVAPQEAEAASAISYPVTITFEHNSGSNGGYIKILYFEVNADGTLVDGVEKEYLFINSLKNFTASSQTVSTSDNRGTGSATGNVPGIPYKIEMYVAASTEYVMKKVQIGDLTVMNDTWTIKNKVVHWQYDGTGNWGNASPPSDWALPYVKTISNPSDINLTVPKIDSTSTVSGSTSVTIKDQYGVVMPLSSGITYDYALVNTMGYTGVFLDDNMSNGTSTATVTVNADVQKELTSSSTDGKVQYKLWAKYGSLTSNQCTVTITCPQYTAYYKSATTGAIVKTETAGYYNSTYTSNAAPYTNTTTKDNGDGTHTYYTWPASKAYTVSGDITITEAANTAAHGWDAGTVTQAASCTAVGSKLFNCATCGATKTEEIPKIAHNYTTAITAPTCSAEGYTTYTCSVCGYNYKDNYTATIAHNWDDGVQTTAPTCAVAGVKTYTCLVCGATKTEDIAATGIHNYVVEVAGTRVDSTCTVNGSVEMKCDLCTATEVQTLDIDDSKHTNVVTDEAYESTCKIPGKTEGSHCEDCGAVITAQQDLPLKDHTEEIIAAIDPDCTTPGKTEGKRCSVCKDILVAQQEVPAKGHDWSDTYISNGNGINATHYQNCDVCGVKGANAAHTWNSGEVSVEATCEKDGEMLYTCSANGCGAKYIARITSPGHAYGEWIEEDSATCLEGGIKGHYECSACGKYFDEDKNEIADLAIEALNHAIVKHAGQAATCTEGGWEAYETCSRCDYTTYKAIDALDHDYIDHAAKAPTCTEKGWDAYKTCSRCDYTTYEEKPAAGHDYGEWIAEVEADCNNAGTLGHYQCSVCNKYFDADKKELKDLTINALGHDYISHEGKAATCTEGGWKAYETCSRCDYTTYEAIEALDHDYISHKGQAATCTEDGWKAYETCSRCDYTTYEKIEASGHSITTYEGKDATCTKDGWKAYEACSKCDYTTYEAIGSLGHDYIAHEGKDATCTEGGWKAYETCSRCDYTTYEAIGSLGHDYIDHEGKDATCLEGGWKAYETCSRCDYTTYEEVPAAGHSIISVGSKAPTCEEIGWDAYEKCTKCDYTTYEEIPATNHSIITIPAKAATCTEIGWEEYEYCEKCDYTTYVEIPTNGGHDLEYFDAKAVTCTENGWEAYEACKRCDYTTKVEIIAQGHAYVDHEGKAPTCTQDGWEAYQTCENCDYTTYKVVAAYQHSIVNIPAKAATCGVAGWEAYEMCLRCDYTTKTEIPALEHSIKQYEAQAPGCESEGWEAHEACENCDYTTKVTIPATGHSIKQYEAQAPTCAQAGWEAYEACENCDYTTKTEIPALKHEYVNHDGKDATCSTEGWKPYQTCKNCDYTSYEAIPTLEHNLVEYPAKAPTCKEIGWEAYEECTRCDYTTYKELPMTEHNDEDGDGICDDCTTNIGCAHTNIVTTVVNPTCLSHGKVTETCGDCGKLISEIVIAPTGHHDHDGDGECDECSAPTTASTSCGCICHKDSLIMRIIYAICRFFWKLFKITRTCNCGAYHY